MTDDTQPAAPHAPLDKTYAPAEIEPRISAAWEAANAFAPSGQGEPFCIMIPPPNVTGSLHMGHALDNTLQDVLVRFMRMRGRDVLWQPGLDHAGIATQNVVERRLAAAGKPDRREMGRAAFIEEVWRWKDESGGTIVGQLRRLGASCDWSRLRFTMDEGMSRAVTQAFVRLYEDKLIKPGKRLVNWDCALLTAISDLEVENRETAGHYWHFRYPLEGVAFDVADPSTFIVVATTRPETMLGDTAVAVHPEDERYVALVARKARVTLPLVGRSIPIIADDYADPEKGSGAVKITPAHDFNDEKVAKRFNESGQRWSSDRADMPFINILSPNGCIIGGSGPGHLMALEREVPEKLKLRGLDRVTARKQVVKMMTAGGYLEKEEPAIIQVPYGDRSGTMIEPYRTDQWFLDASALAGPAMDAVRDGRTRFHPQGWENTYFSWMENIQPWCISRQLWWGHRIPAWYGPMILENGDLDYHHDPARQLIFVAENELQALQRAREHYAPRQVVRSDNFLHAALFAGLNDDDHRVRISQDEDVLDTWFSSGLWPFSTLGWPDTTPEIARFYPTQTLVTGFDIIFFWVARMMMMGMHLGPRAPDGSKQPPFADVVIHALVRDEAGQKMSKSKGNVVDPLELMDAYGADALRFTMAAMATPGRDLRLSTARVEGYRNFATKLWNAARFAEMNGCVPVTGFRPEDASAPANRWILGEAAAASAAIAAAIEAYRFDEAAAAAYRFVRDDVCDWYLELAKPAFAEGADAAAETRATTAHVLGAALRLLHPFMPFVTEALWPRFRLPADAELLIAADWPAAGFADIAAKTETEALIALVTAVRSARAELGVPAGAKLRLVILSGPQRAAAHSAQAQRLARLSAVDFADAPPPGAIEIIVGETRAALDLGGAIDVAAETERLAREIGKLEAEAGKVASRLADERFTAKAPPHIIAENTARRDEIATKLGGMRAAQARILAIRA